MINIPIIYFSTCLISYLIGAIPFGFLIAKSQGIDIQTVGSQNIGATNVFRSVGPKWGIITFILDFLKGFIPVLFAKLFAARLSTETHSIHAHILPLSCMISAIIGHSLPVYLKFKGGKGVATGTGALLAIAPSAVLTGIIAWIIVFYLFRYVSLASILTVIAVSIFSWGNFIYSKINISIPVVITIISIIIILRHHANIRRLLSGTELKFGKKNKENNNQKKQE